MPRIAPRRSFRVTVLACGVALIGSAGATAASVLPLTAAHAPPGRHLGGAGLIGQELGLYVAFCPYGRESRARRWASPEASVASTSHAGWPPDECLKMDKGPAGRSHTIVGSRRVHNWLLGGYGNDTIIGGNRGDVIWGDYHPTGEPAHQTAVIHGGDGQNFIYANDTRNYVWTGTNPRTVVHAHNPGTSGIIHCESAGIVVYLSKVSERDFKLEGCLHISHYSVGY